MIARIVLGVAALLALGGGASAHATFVRSTPEAYSNVREPPGEVRVEFSEEVEPRFSEMLVLDAGRARVAGGAVSAVDAVTLRISLPNLSTGGYTVSWRVLSAVDGHETRGAFVFSVGDAPLPSLPEIEGIPPPTAIEIAGRVLSFGGAALLFGVPLFALLIARRPDERSGSRGLVRAGGLALLAGTALLTVDAGGLAVLAGSRVGAVMLLRGAAALAGLVLPWTLASLGAGAGAVAGLTLLSHATATGRLGEMALDFAHALAASAWVGGLAMLALRVLPAFRTGGARDSRSLGSLVGRFSTLGVVSVAIIAVTGAFQSLTRLADPRDLVATTYGLALLAKIVLLVPAVALAAFNLLRHGPSLRRGTGAPRRALLRNVRGEVALVSGVLVAAAFLTALAPPAFQSGAAYSSVQYEGGLRMQLLAESTNPGVNRFLLRLAEPFGGAPRNIDKVVLRFTMVEHDMGEQELVLRERAPGEYAADGSPTSMFGTWKVQVVVRRTDREDARAVLTLPIAAPAGSVAAQLVRIDTVSLVVFTDPAVPRAGEPFTIWAVAIDPNGDPLGGAAITAIFESRSIVALAETGGRYRLDVPALEAGERTVRLALVSSIERGEGDYLLRVGR